MLRVEGGKSAYVGSLSLGASQDSPVSNDFLHWKFKHKRLKVRSHAPIKGLFLFLIKTVVTVATRILLMALIAILFPDIQLSIGHVPFLAQRDGVPSAISFLEARYLLCCWCGAAFPLRLLGVTPITPILKSIFTNLISLSSVKCASRRWSRFLGFLFQQVKFRI